MPINFDCLWQKLDSYGNVLPFEVWMQKIICTGWPKPKFTIFFFFSGLFATVRKCVHRETGITYAAKFSSRVRYGVDCSMEILHEIAMLSVCMDSNKIVHLKDVFQNRHEIILVLE